MYGKADDTGGESSIISEAELYDLFRADFASKVCFTRHNANADRIDFIEQRALSG